MVKRDLHELWEKYKIKIYIVISIILVICFFVVLFTNYFSSQEKNENNDNTVQSVYQPSKTVIKGEEVKKKKYEDDAKIIKNFMDFCNNNDVRNAYELLTDDCKKNEYKTLQDFKDKFYTQIYTKKRNYTIQSWINNSEFTTYKVRITDDILATGDYSSSVKFETYITTYKDENKDKISIGEFLYEKKLKTKDDSNIVDVISLRQRIYKSKEVYVITIKNISKNRILLYDKKETSSIRLYGGGSAYEPYYDKLINNNYLVEVGETVEITLSFDKSAGSNNKSSYINIKNVVEDYDKYIQNINDYKEERGTIKISF